MLVPHTSICLIKQVSDAGRNSIIIFQVTSQVTSDLLSVKPNPSMAAKSAIFIRGRQ